MAHPSGDVYAETLAVFDQPGEPLTTTEVGETLGVPRRTAYKRLDTLVGHGELRTKKVGSRARVWWRPSTVSADADDPLDDRAFRAVFEAAFDAMILADATGRWVAVNDAACELFGRPREALLGEAPGSFAPPDYDAEAAWAEFLESDLDRGIYPLVRPDGEQRTAEFAATLDVLPGLHLSILRDVTEREATREELERLHHLNTVVRGVDRATTHATSTQGLADDLCATLVESDYYQYATLCATPVQGPRFDVLATVGDDTLVETLGSVALSPVDSAPGRRALDTGTVQVRRLPTTDRTDEWLTALADHGVRSLAAVPLVHDGVDRGLLVVGSDRRAVFDDEERTILAELGASLANAVATLDRPRSGMADQYLAVTLQSRDVLGPLASRTDLEGATVTLERVVPLDEGIVSYYVLRGIPPEPLLEYLPHVDVDVEVRLLDRTDDRSWLEVRSYDSPTAAVVSQFGGRVASATVEHGVVNVVVEVPTGTNVRALAGAFERIVPDVSVVAQEHRHRRDTTDRRLLTAFGRQLTARQQTALELALYGGYFDWPRRTTGAELAETMDVHPSTLHYHLRAAERKLLTALFDTTDDST